jgi:hypothetical protein
MVSAFKRISIIALRSRRPVNSTAESGLKCHGTVSVGMEILASVLPVTDLHH